jgi:CheY-like chemotaxis protein
MNDFRITTGISLAGGFNIIYPALLQNFDSDQTESSNDNFQRPFHDIKQKKLSIVLADDDEDDRDLFKEAIHELAIKPNLEMAKDGKALIELLNRIEELPDIIFLDLNMPHKSGKECLVEIRNNARLKNIPVIIYSTSSSPTDIEETYGLGANLYVKKPSSFTELTAYLNKLLTMDWNKCKPHSSRNRYFFMPKK